MADISTIIMRQARVYQKALGARLQLGCSNRGAKNTVKKFNGGSLKIYLKQDLDQIQAAVIEIPTMTLSVFKLNY